MSGIRGRIFSVVSASLLGLVFTMSIASATDAQTRQDKIDRALSRLQEQGAAKLWRGFVRTFSKTNAKIHIDRNFIEADRNDVSVVVDELVPGIHDVLQKIVDNLDDLSIEEGDGKIQFDATLEPNELLFPFTERSESKVGQIYAAKIEKHIHLELFVVRDTAFVSNVQGLAALVKIPILPDTVYFTSAEMDTESQITTVRARAVGRAVEVIGKVDMREKRFTGVDWFHTILGSISLSMSDFSLFSMLSG